jgi:very-short-patch-repair endonuclease
VLDFYCPVAKLAIEIDGDAHDMGENPERDERRDEWVRARGVDVLRIPAEHFFGDIEPAIRMILSRCGAGPSTAP